MLSKNSFDLWADDYDKTVQVSEENNQYPFAGYKQILNMIFNEVMKKQKSNVLDIGFGTGVLTHKLYDHSHQIDGLDFSTKMKEIAQFKMPTANLIEWDITNGLPPEIMEKTYDSIVSTYTLHHLTDEEKIPFIEQLASLLEEGGQLLIGDIAFESREELNACRLENLDVWDEDEFYLVYNEIKLSLSNTLHCEFYPISHCGGVIVISK
ncbi:class I SAM-dependent methyltransferase [Alkalibacillus salilacus]|uniref:AdoMet-dependent methyltransferase n=1 Tax=Alkalibacillus salilacus TaxID=284582 RepID=A0ABT9VGD8_9BACI|nr:class I SAM-dependent methyltransferase [Alkalibacillus salilacus]MDQ0159979.1 putative AdoMet-dependent methyltransferase [Alkalibacillus salilacus]